MLTRKDIELLKVTFPTKENIKNRLDQQKDDILSDVDEKLKKQSDEIINAVADLVADGINPILDAHEKRMPFMAN